MNSVLLFHSNIDIASALSDSLEQPSAIMESDVVQFPLKFPSMPSYPITTIQAPLPPLFFAYLDTKSVKLVIRLRTVKGAFAFDLISVSWWSKVLGDNDAGIFCAPESFMCG